MIKDMELSTRLNKKLFTFATGVIMSGIVIMTTTGCSANNKAESDNLNVNTNVEQNETVKSEEADKEKIPEGATLADVETLNKEYYILLENEKKWCIDLDGDGTYETIKYELTGDRENDIAGDEELHIYINDKDIACEEPKYCEGIWEEFAICDLNNSDEKYEIAILSNGASGDYSTYFYSYDKGENNYLGSISDTIDNAYLNVDNTSGKIKYADWIDAMGTMWIYKYCQYDKSSNTLEDIEVKDGCYDCANYNELTCDEELLKDVYVYKDCNKDSEKILMKAQNTQFEKIKIIGDGVFWIYIIAEDKTEGWIEVDHLKIDGEDAENYFVYSFCG